MDYLETLDRIYNLRGGVIDLRLERMDGALALFDHPEKTFPSFHIAGTNGKGSTAAMLHRILCSAGYRTALYTSPHLVSFTERMRIGEEEITPEEVVALAHEIWHRTDAANIRVNVFRDSYRDGISIFLAPAGRSRSDRSRAWRSLRCNQFSAFRGVGYHDYF